MEWTNEQLIETARIVSKYESEKAAQLLNELATRFECSLLAARTACADRSALAAENAGLKSGVTYFACGSEYGFDLFSDKQSAIDTAQEEIELHREAYLDGSGDWEKGVERTAWGIVIQSAQRISTAGYQVSGSQLAEHACDYQLEYEVKTQAADALLAEVRAQAIDNISNLLMDAQTATNEVSGMAKAIGICEEFAAQLRKGDQS